MNAEQLLKQQKDLYEHLIAIKVELNNINHKRTKLHSEYSDKLEDLKKIGYDLIESLEL